MAYEYAYCYGIVKGKTPSKGVQFFKADSYESAIRKVKTYAKGNYSSNEKTATLFYNGTAFGWCFKNDGAIIYLDRWDLEYIGLIPKRK